MKRSRNLSECIPSIAWTLQTLSILMISGCIHSSVPKKPLPLRRQISVAKPKTRNIRPNPPKPIIRTSCKSYHEFSQGFPAWVPEKGFAITRMLQECKEPGGQQGYETDSPWVAMGIPCSGGDGTTIIGGAYWLPKIVSFPITTDCPMQPQLREQVSEDGKQIAGISAKSEAAALNPFSLQYWEIPSVQEADVSASIELRSSESKALWRPFLEGTPIPVDLYGRENAWGNMRHFFHISGEIYHTGVRRFRFKPLHFRTLSPADIQLVKERCEALQPARNCQQIFP
ncbi:MAG: hypothetical protein H6618_03255 [Deltaproteobacteria bacterium]|nr:hypothetical protein [Deltaproteobacteria bacterium]